MKMSGIGSDGPSTSILKDGRKCANQNIQVYVRQRPLNSRERNLRSLEVVDVVSSREIVARHSVDSKITKKFTFDRAFGANSRQVEVYTVVVAPLVSEVIAGYNCTVFAYGQTGTGKTHTMVGTACPNLTSSWDDDTEVGIIPRALSHLIDELRLLGVDYSMRISYLELYNEELCDLLSTDDTVRIRIFDDSTKKGSVIIHGLEEIPVHTKDDVYKLLEKGQERRRTASTLMNAQSSRSHTVFSITVHIREIGIDGEELLKIGKLNLVDLAGSENATKAGTDKSIRVREAVNINQSLLTLGRVITALVERTPHIPYRESKLTRLLQESLGGRTKTSIIATISPGHKDIEETLSTLQYADRAKSIQNKPEINQKLTKAIVLKEYSEEIEKLKRDLIACRDKNGIYLSEEHFNELNNKIDAQTRELNEKVLLIKALKDEMQNKERIFTEVSDNLAQKQTELQATENTLHETQSVLRQKERILHNTKKRYHEKKVILQSHVRTEETLTKQATEILKVADVATNDTHQLHNTIERRKNVDQQIEKTCEQFTAQMKERFNNLESHLKSHEEHQKLKISFINQQLQSKMDRQKELNTKTSDQINEIFKVFGETFDKSKAIESDALNSLKNISEEHKKTFCELLQKQKEFYETQENQIRIILNRLEQNRIEQNEIANNLFSTTQKSFETLSKESNNFSNMLKTQIANNFTLVEESLNKTNALKENIENDNVLLKEEQTMFEEFMQKMCTFREKRFIQNEKKLQITKELNETCMDLKQELTNCDNDSKTFFENQNISQQSIQKDLESQIMLSQNLIETNEFDLIQLQNDNTTFEKQNKENIDEFLLKENENCEQLQKSFKELSIKSSNLLKERKEVHDTTVESIKTNVDNYVHKSNLTLLLVDSFTKDLENTLNTYTEDHKGQIFKCVNDIEKFKNSELKTYKPTGATPSKRDFKYPRVLAATSPHDKIIKRLRQENDYSDLNVTMTIDEEDTELSLVESFSVENSSNKIAQANSTPLHKYEEDKENIPNGF